MNVIQEKNGNELLLKLEGRLDTTTAPNLDEVLAAELDGIQKLIFDFSSLEYLSSAGLRSLLSAQKKMNAQGSMIIKNVSEMISEIFEVTGFSDILTIE